MNELYDVDDEVYNILGSQSTTFGTESHTISIPTCRDPNYRPLTPDNKSAPPSSTGSQSAFRPYKSEHQQHPGRQHVNQHSGLATKCVQVRTSNIQLSTGASCMDDKLSCRVRKAPVLPSAGQTNHCNYKSSSTNRLLSEVIMINHHRQSLTF